MTVCLLAYVEVLRNTFQIDPTLVRLGWVAFTALGGSGILAYIILAVIVPSEY